MLLECPVSNWPILLLLEALLDVFLLPDGHISHMVPESPHDYVYCCCINRFLPRLPVLWGKELYFVHLKYTRLCWLKFWMNEINFIKNDYCTWQHMHVTPNVLKLWPVTMVAVNQFLELGLCTRQWWSFNNFHKISQSERGMGGTEKKRKRKLLEDNTELLEISNEENSRERAEQQRDWVLLSPHAWSISLVID